jgi:UDP-glucose 4-epimerase
MKKALICGISGQDGSYLAHFLLEKGYQVFGTSRDAQMSSFQNLSYLGIREQVNLESMAINDFRSVLQIFMKVRPDEVYNLAGQSSVGLSFHQPVETLESISVGTLNLLESIRFVGEAIRFYNPVQANVLVIQTELQQMRLRHFIREVLMQWQKQPHSGRWQIIGRLMDCLPVLVFFSTTILLYVLNDLLPEKSFQPHVGLPPEAKKPFG